jgi:hypothetical protein
MASSTYVSRQIKWDRGVVLSLALPHFACSQWPQHSGTKQVQLGAVIHLSLVEFEFVDLAFSLAVAPRRGERRANRSDVLTQPVASVCHARMPVRIAAWSQGSSCASARVRTMAKKRWAGS